MTWMYQGLPFDPTPEQLKTYAGFTYIVRERSTGRFYIGEKSLHQRRKAKPDAKRRTKSESDWRRYRTSNVYLKSAMKLNPDDFEKTILHLCRTEAEMHFREVEEMFKRHALYDPLSLNGNIAGRWFAERVRLMLV